MSSEDTYEIVTYMSSESDVDSSKMTSLLSKTSVLCDDYEENCGEPFSPQHLVIDFTPVESNDLDTEFVQKKCCAFWDFINKNLDIKHLQVIPEPDSDLENICHSSIAMTQTIEDKSKKIDKTALAALEIAKAKGIFEDAFKTDLHQSMCTFDTPEYENEMSPMTSTQGSPKYKAASVLPKSSKGSVPLTTENKSLPAVRKMCDNLQKWDEEHPKSMEPPGHSPNLIHSIMKR